MLSTVSETCKARLTCRLQQTAYRDEKNICLEQVLLWIVDKLGATVVTAAQNSGVEDFSRSCQTGASFIPVLLGDTFSGGNDQISPRYLAMPGIF